jgi:raffinose/stachyose/melibiose transport system substrate-binding protein
MFGRVAQNSEMVSSGQIMDITGQKFLDNFNAGAVGASSIGGKVYGIPVDLMATGVFYNKAVFEKAGVKVPTTATEFYAVCEAVKKTGVIPVSLGLKESWPVLMLYWCDLYGALLVKYPDWRADAMDRKITFAGTPEMKPAFEQIRKTYGYVNPDGWNVDYTKSLQAVATGEAAMAIYGSYCIPEIRKYSKDGNFGYFPLPTTGTATGNIVSAGIDDGFMVMEGSKQKESALLYLAHMSKKEVAVLWASTIQTISAVKDVTFDKADPMLSDAISFINKGPIVLDGMTPMLAGEYDSEFTNALIKFLMDPKISVDQLLKDLDATFDNIKAKS